jgi:hypothetical protein
MSRAVQLSTNERKCHPKRTVLNSIDYKSVRRVATLATLELREKAGERTVKCARPSTHVSRFHGIEGVPVAVLPQRQNRISNTVFGL